ncbi:hypothetical protein [Oceanirhabdus seepicola]|uniref:Uncharacterized protein n=1 Tax=Oceanirhabdus seepicola TaxID=2828781 RepID=A0A9J6PAI3_9CLOT|nr:hypothetical protein [Oceanirhabdus seepicola]MCM1992790.1 hypothetical protein [Oceanirhabdus seepicola]
MLVAWTEFLKNTESEKVRILEMRSIIIKDKVIALNKTKEEFRKMRGYY